MNQFSALNILKLIVTYLYVALFDMAVDEKRRNFASVVVNNPFCFYFKRIGYIKSLQVNK